VLGLFVFAISVASIIYVLFGYPLLLAVIAKRAARPIRKHFEPKSVSVLLPVRNGEIWLEAKLHSIFNLNYPRELLQVIVALDRCTDRSEAIARKFNSVVVMHSTGSGKAAGLNTALTAATGEVLFYTDVRQRLDANALRQLVACLGDPNVGVASGELIILEGKTNEEANTGLYWKYEKWIRRNLSAIDSIPGATGSIYAMRRELAVKLPEDTLLDDVHQPLAAFFQGYRLILDESAKAYDYPTSLDSEFNRKVRTLAGIFQVVAHYPALLGPRNRMWIHFLSHKIGRLALPYALIAVALSSLWLPEPLRSLALAGQALFYGLALFDYVMPDWLILKRITSPIRTFVVLVAAALVAASILFRSSKSFWKETRVVLTNN
jgi:cellulose synthase/poly-beta-1,6-N-acetylglucosamine synthase-like glycosyltransferase